MFTRPTHLPEVSFSVSFNEVSAVFISSADSETISFELLFLARVGVCVLKGATTRHFKIAPVIFRMMKCNKGGWGGDEGIFPPQPLSHV